MGTEPLICYQIYTILPKVYGFLTSHTHTCAFQTSHFRFIPPLSLSLLVSLWICAHSMISVLVSLSTDVGWGVVVLSYSTQRHSRQMCVLWQQFFQGSHMGILIRYPHTFDYIVTNYNVYILLKYKEIRYHEQPICVATWETPSHDDSFTFSTRQSPILKCVPSLCVFQLEVKL